MLPFEKIKHCWFSTSHYGSNGGKPWGSAQMNSQDNRWIYEALRMVGIDFVVIHHSSQGWLVMPAGSKNVEQAVSTEGRVDIRYSGLVMTDRKLWSWYEDRAVLRWTQLWLKSIRRPLCLPITSQIILNSICHIYIYIPHPCCVKNTAPTVCHFRQHCYSYSLASSWAPGTKRTVCRAASQMSAVS